MASIDRSFLGTGWSFPPTFRREWYGPEMLTEEADVKSSIQIILATITGERVMLPTFGCNLQPHVFDQMNVPTIAMIEKIVREALVFHEPRIIVESLTTTPFQGEGRLEINIEYSIIKTNTRYNYVFPFYITEATNIETVKPV
ncbi:GPW/gp25 family protein [Chitinophaga agrisoli]|uniref:GPW/gp25 family protein n=1 Tax=Chitinophaga agrisoli TaxID=2607653 RepID=A0A5B2VI78_9BACT|nr:GPW/gp25 family protein [Chitinophaga agrisoli]KAA2239283.1 GPW/gp25 family protein [Chitinophaga agrisoli]